MERWKELEREMEKKKKKKENKTPFKSKQDVLLDDTYLT